mgnify:FL=1
MYYHLIETIVILAIASGSLIYLLSRWFPVLKNMVMEVFFNRFPRVSRLFRAESGSATVVNAKGSSGCFGCAPTGACGDCPTNRG